MTPKISFRFPVYRKYEKSKYTPAPTAAVHGIVMTHAETIWYATFQWTAWKRFAQPTPRTEPVTTCVVETGMWSIVAVKIVSAELSSDAKP